jgi:hypothetical protein
MRSKAHTTPTTPLVLHCTRLDKCPMKIFSINGHLRKELFLIVIHRFSLVKAAKNSLYVCKMRNGVSKTPSFSSFFNCPSAQWIFSAAIYTKLLYNYKLKNKKKRSYTLKGSQRMGGRADFSKKPSAPLSLIKTYRMSLISAGPSFWTVPLEQPWLLFCSYSFWDRWSL